MPFGGGKFGDECTALQGQLDADAVLLVVVVLGGPRGHGFSVTVSERALDRLKEIPALLRTVADTIEADIASRAGRLV